MPRPTIASIKFRSLDLPSATSAWQAVPKHDTTGPSGIATVLSCDDCAIVKIDNGSAYDATASYTYNMSNTATKVVIRPRRPDLPLQERIAA